MVINKMETKVTEEKTFTWLPFFNELFQKICEKEDKKSLAEKFNKVFGNKKTDSNNTKKKLPFDFMDPLTFIAFFNRREKEEKRIKYCKNAADIFKLKATVPSDFNGIPIYICMNSLFFDIKSNNRENIDDIEKLWKFAKSINNNLNKKLFNELLKDEKNKIGLSKLTQFLFIVKPNDYYSTDKRALDYAITKSYIKKFPEKSFNSYDKYRRNIKENAEKNEVEPYKFSFNAYNYIYDFANFNEYKSEIEKEMYMCAFELNNSKDDLKHGNKTKKIIESYRRSFLEKKYALENANYKCELNQEHETFFREGKEQQFLEGHHLIPLTVQGDNCFKNISIDNHENIVVLCPNCHREIHFGENKANLIKKLFEVRQSKLEKEGIKITLNQLLKYYKINYIADISNND